jgi:hypothetical protein
VRHVVEDVSKVGLGDLDVGGVSEADGGGVAERAEVGVRVAGDPHARGRERQRRLGRQRRWHPVLVVVVVAPQLVPLLRRRRRRLVVVVLVGVVRRQDDVRRHRGERCDRDTGREGEAFGCVAPRVMDGPRFSSFDSMSAAAQAEADAEADADEAVAPPVCFFNNDEARKVRGPRSVGRSECSRRQLPLVLMNGGGRCARAWFCGFASRNACGGYGGVASRFWREARPCGERRCPVASTGRFWMLAVAGGVRAPLRVCLFWVRSRSAGLWDQGILCRPVGCRKNLGAW